MKLPIDDLLPRIVAEQSRNIVIEAAPGAGKTTRVPPALIERGGVLVLDSQLRAGASGGVAAVLA